MRFYILLVFPVEWNKGMKYVFIFLFFLGQLNAQTNDCPWAGEDKTICLGECVIIGCEDAQGSDVCPIWRPTTFISEGYPPHSAVIEVCPTETTTYTIYITNAEGSLIDTDEVTVFVEPPRLEMSSDPYTICKGEVMTLTAILENGNPASYLWSTGETSPSIDVSPEFSANYKVTVTDASTGCVLENDTWARVYLMDDIEIYAIFPSICELQDIGFTNPNEGSRFAPPTDCNHSSTMLFTDSNPNNIYLWNTGETTFFKYAHTEGIHSVTVTNPDGCERIASYEVTSCDAVDINPDIMMNTNGENVTILNAGEGYVSYEWSDGSTGQTLEIDSPGDYSVTVVNEEGCVSRAATNIEGCGEFAAFLILHALDDEHRKQNIFISNSSQFTEGNSAFSSNDRALIENYINENRGLLALAPTPLGYETIFHWVCNESATSCLVESNDEHLVLKNDATKISFSSLIVKKNQNNLPERLLNCMSDGALKFYTSILEIVDGSLEQRITPQTAGSYGYSSFNEFAILPNNEFQAKLTIQTSFEYENITDEIVMSTGVVVKMNVKLEVPEDPFEYVITHNGEAVIEPISANESTQLLFEVARVADSGELIPINNMGDENVTSLVWNYGHIEGISSNSQLLGIVQYLYAVPQVEAEGGSSVLTLSVNSNSNLEATIISINVPAVPGFHHDDTPNASMTAPKSMMTLMDYVECARMRIETYDNENSDYDLYSTIFGEDSDLSVNIHLYSDALDIRAGYTSVPLSVSPLLILDKNSIEVPPYPDCPIVTNPKFLKLISDDDKMLIEAAIVDITGEIPIPSVVSRINDYDLSVGMLLVEWCNYESNEINQVDDALAELGNLKIGNKLFYRPTESELDGFILMPESVDIYLNYEKLNNVVDYGRLRIHRTDGTYPSPTRINMNEWYEQSGDNVNPIIPNYSQSVGNNPSRFVTDLDKFRCRQYRNVLAHELGHVKSAMEDKNSYYIWGLIINEYEITHYNLKDASNRCYPHNVNNSAYCSTTRGHELGNPTNFDSCESVIEAWYDFIILRYQHL